MNSKSLRRLAADHGSLHTAGLPPNYLFPPGADDAADLTSLDILLAGPIGTPYASGVWRLHLDIPPTYPTAPPTAQFRTRLWHPNIDEATGAVCVETLKRDWSSTLKLRDVLVTISCLLIQPNPASALNEAAGKLAVEDWNGYCRRAKLMTDMHAAVPRHMADDVREAQMRGEDKTTEPVKERVAKPTNKGKGKEHVNITPAGPKLQRPASEDEENRRGHARTRGKGNNAFGIKGLRDLNTPPKRVFGGTHTPTTTSPPPPTDENVTKNAQAEDKDPFITVTSKRNAHTLQLTSTETTTTTAAESDKTTAADTQTPDLLTFSHQNPFSAIQLNNQTHPFFTEFSYSWADAAVLHDGCLKEDSSGMGGESGVGVGPAATKAAVRKRLATEAFGKKKTWEMKRFKRAGCDLKTFNRGDFGPRTGVGRL